MQHRVMQLGLRCCQEDVRKRGILDDPVEYPTIGLALLCYPVAGRSLHLTSAGVERIDREIVIVLKLPLHLLTRDTCWQFLRHEHLGFLE